MEAAFATLDLTTLKTYLGEALTAMHRLATGAAEVEVEVVGEHRVKYQQSGRLQLQQYIAALQAAIAKKGGTARRPIHIAL